MNYDEPISASAEISAQGQDSTDLSEGELDSVTGGAGGIHITPPFIPQPTIPRGIHTPPRGVRPPAPMPDFGVPTTFSGPQRQPQHFPPTYSEQE